MVSPVWAARPSSVRPRRVLVAAVVAAALVAVGCGPVRRPPRFGSLTADPRTFSFAHGIELLRAKNGLVIAILPDRRTNLVTVDVRYQVGAAEDPAGRAGLAHLVEHLAFEAQPEPGGPTLGDRLADAALSYNAWTTWDETHYTSTALADRVDELLAIEAARMQVTCDQLDEARFLRERDVVLEEEAERASGGAALRDELARAVWGANHPYARGIGTREVATATREEACAFLADHYAPDRAILVITGDVDVAAVSAKVGAQFGPIARRSAKPRAPLDAPRLGGTRSEHTADVDDAAAVVFYEAPAWGGDGEVGFDLASAYLRAELGAAADERKWITDVGVGTFGGARSRVAAIAVWVDDPARLDDAVELVHATARGLASRRARRADVAQAYEASLRTQYVAAWDDFLRRGAWLADYLQYTTHGWFFLRALQELDGGGSDPKAWVGRMTPERSHVALIRPSGRAGSEPRVRIATSEKEHDLAPWRAPVDPAEAERPLTIPAGRAGGAVEEVTLANGLRVLLAPDPTSPVVEARLVFPVGSAADPAGRRGVAFATAEVIDHDTEAEYGSVDRERIVWAFTLGTQLAWDVGEQRTVFASRGLATFADWHVWRLFWLLDAGVFPGDAIRRLRERFDDEPEVDPGDRALRAALFGADHPYAAPPLGPAEVKAIGAGDLERFRREHYRARGATLIVAGGFDPAAMKREIEELFGAWPGDAPPEVAAVPAIAPAAGPVYLAVRDDERSQAAVTIAFAASSSPQRDRAARLVLERIVEDRMRVVREGLGASYGVHAAYGDGAGGSVLRIDGALDPERAGKALAAMLGELAAIRDGAAGLAEDFVRARRRALAAVLADAAGTRDLADELQVLAEHGLPVGWTEQLVAEVAAVTPAQVAELAARDLAAARMVVRVTGRPAVVEEAYRRAGIDLGAVQTVE